MTDTDLTVTSTTATAPKSSIVIGAGMAGIIKLAHRCFVSKKIPTCFTYVVSQPPSLAYACTWLVMIGPRQRQQ
jgi:predicted alpha/beta superfamily hydrolase